MTAADSSEPTGDGDNGFDDSQRPMHPLRNWRQPLLTAITMAVAVGLVSLVDRNPGPLVLAAALSMTLARNRLVLTWRGRAEAVILLPVLGLTTAGVAYLLFHVPILGAAAYVAALFLSIWLRRFGPTWHRIGSLIALPFITLLIAPAGGAGTTVLSVILVSVAALVVVVLLRVLAELVRFVPRTTRSARGESPAPPTPPTPAPTSGGMFVSTKMAIQMAIALTGAFVFGFLFFPEHFAWLLLTAFIVCSGNRGRADVLYKSGLRILGAASGTILASFYLLVLPAGHLALQGPQLVVVLLVILSIGLWLREWTYAAWAVAMTLVITLIQGAVGSTVTGGIPEGTELWTRILAIIVGAACGVVASWFVLPVRSEGVVRKRLAGALAALSEFAAAPSPLTDEGLAVSLERLDEVAAPWAAWERISAWRTTDRKPGQWMQLVHESARLVRRRPALSPAASRALGDARKSIRDPLAIGRALASFRDELHSGTN